MSQYAVLYRLAEDWFDRDQVLLRRAYEELADQQPLWLTCETFHLTEDEWIRIFLLDGDTDRVSSQLGASAAYWETLPDRCLGDPTLVALTRAGIDRLAVSRIAFWNPYRRSCALPTPRARGGGVDEGRPADRRLRTGRD